MKSKSLATASLAALFLIASPMVPETLAGKETDTLIWATDRELNVPLVWWDSTTEMAAMMYHVFDNLIYRDPIEGQYKPLLAKSWTWIDSRTLEFELREDVIFHDGSRFGPEDVVATYTNLLKPDAKVLNKTLIDWMERVEAIGENKIRITMHRPFPAALEFLSGSRMAILPSEVWEELPRSPTGEVQYSAVKPIGTGPYKMTEWVAGEKAVLTRNESYFDGPKGQPAIGTLEFRTVPDQETRIAELMVGGIDWIMSVPKDKADDLRTQPNITVTDGPDMRIAYLQFDVTGRSGNSPLTNLNVRKAIAHAIDREAISRNLVGGASKVVHSACYPEQFGCSEDVPRYEYDPEKAKELLKEAGFKDRIAIELNAYREREYAEAIIGYLNAVGIDAKLNFLQWAAIRSKIQSGKAELSMMTWASSGLNDVSAITSVWFKHSSDDYCLDDEIKNWLDEGDATIDPEQRAATYKKALIKIQEKLCWLPLFSYSMTYAYTSDLNFVPTSDGFPLFFLASWK